MIEFLKFLSFLRREVNTNIKKYFSVLLGSEVIFLLTAILIDRFLPWNIIFNFIRCIFAIIGSIINFCIIYGILHKLEYNKNKEALRRGFSFNQRVNISIIIISFTVLFHLMIVKPKNLGYTFLSSIILCVWIYLIVFIRPFKYELDRESYGIDDERDL